MELKGDFIPSISYRMIDPHSNISSLEEEYFHRLIADKSMAK